jgi:hypothetical protein
MADVTITDLSDLAPASNTYIPLSDGTTTGKAQLSSIPGITPVGGIIMWSGSIANIPTNWALCNGSNGTPDLRNKFIIGANADNAGVANTNITGTNTQTGGTKDAIVVSHSHGITDPGHTHTLNYTVPLRANDTDRGGFNSNFSVDSTPVTPDTLSKTTGITINTAGESGTNQNLPPYYALAYIMRTS